MAIIGKYELRFAGVFALVLTIWLAGGIGMHGGYADRNNHKHLQELAGQLVTRAEKAIDFVVIANTELLTAGLTECGSSTQGILRNLVVNTGTVSNIFLVTPHGTCSAFDNFDAVLPPSEERSTWSEARNPSYRVGKFSAENDSQISVSWGLGTDLEVIVSIAADGIIFDVLPNELRSTGRVDLLANELALASFQGEDAAAANDRSWSTFEADSSRYPLRAVIRVDKVALASWRKDIAAQVVVIWCLCGSLVAAASAYSSIRGRDHAFESAVSALRKREFVPFFQPIVDLKSGRVVGCEALARWQKANGEEVYPGRFIPLLEQHGLDGQLLFAMVEQTAKSFRNELNELPDFYISFNVSPDQLCEPDFAKRLASLVHRLSMQPKQVCIEVTERQVITSPQAAAKSTSVLCESGFRVAIDDAGTGHNGLASLQTLDATTIKIDKFFIDHLDEDPRARIMVELFVSVAGRYGMTTVAEGVETCTQLKSLIELGVDYVQGFYISKPLPAKEFLSSMSTVWSPSINFDDSEIIEQSDRLHEQRGGGFRQLGELDSNERARLEALYSYQILDSEEEEAFDRVPRIIKSALDAPMAAIALIDEERRWFKAVAGGQRGELPRQHSFCNHTIQDSEPTIVPDTLDDVRFRDNLLVVGEPNIRAYLGVPLETPDGHRIGSVCCVDRKPRVFTDEEIQLVKDMSAIVVEQLELRKLALFDSLTSIRSRRGFRTEAELQLDISKRRGLPFSVIMLDIDHFKRINDHHGHSAGDEVLVALCNRVTSVLGDQGIFGRLGGEEFGIAMTNTDLAVALETAQCIRSAVADAPFQTNKGGDIEIRVSVGVACSNQATLDLDTLLENADWALYEAKRNGRDRIDAFGGNAA